jgi:2-keto-3-deoxy-L-rhamnonate aldolase RhmA
MGARIKALLAQNQVVRVFALGQLCHPKIVEIVGWQGGYDAVWLDQEHAGLSIEQIEQATRAARAAAWIRLCGSPRRTMRP